MCTARRTSSWRTSSDSQGLGEADIIAIQERWNIPYTDTTHRPAKQTHELVFPTTNECAGERTRVCMLISKIISQWSYRAWGDAQEVRIERKLAWGGDDAVQDARADALIELTNSADLDLWLAPGTITRENRAIRLLST
ncbi:hypothetical protein N7522_006377 [Penicillium canescens]|nr:hypothetical protein N7522_006377 [Penicillium canescens]